MEKQYYPKYDVISRATFDPRPTRYKCGPSDEALQALRQYAEEIGSALAMQLLPVPDPPPITLETSNDELVCVSSSSPRPLTPAAVEELSSQALVEKCQEVLKSLEDVCKGMTEPFCLSGTEHQHDSNEWHALRAPRATASEAKALIGLLGKRSTQEGKKNFLLKKIWRQGDISKLPAVRYGRQNEPNARAAYIADMERRGVTAHVVLAGMWIDPAFPQLSCSPDGIVIYWENGTLQIALLEIKCPLSLKEKDPNKFDEHLTEKQAKNFCLVRSKDGTIKLKKAHRYNFQVQMSMDILQKVTHCQFVVWSSAGTIIFNVPYDQKFWKPKKMQLLQVHRELILPELVLKKTLQGFPPVLLKW